MRKIIPLKKPRSEKWGQARVFLRAALEGLIIGIILFEIIAITVIINSPREYGNGSTQIYGER